jgi:hypothetical protein
VSLDEKRAATFCSSDSSNAIFPVVNICEPDCSAVFVASVGSAVHTNGTSCELWGSPAAQLLHNYDVSAKHITRLMRLAHSNALRGSNHVSEQQNVPLHRDVVAGLETTTKPSEHSISCMDVDRPSSDGRATSASMQQLDDDVLVFQAVQIDIEGRHAVVKKVVPIPSGGSRQGSSQRSSQACSRGSMMSSRGSMVSGVASSCTSASTSTSFQIGDKWCATAG